MDAGRDADGSGDRALALPRVPIRDVARPAPTLEREFRAVGCGRAEGPRRVA